MTLPPRPPRWALDAGLPHPHADESFDAYWSRMGVPADVIAHVHAGLTGFNAELAHERMHSYVARMTPGAYQRALARIWPRTPPSAAV